MIKYEWKKMLSVPKIIITIVAILAVCIGCRFYEANIQDLDYQAEMLTTYSGLVTGGAVADAAERYQTLSEKLNSEGLTDTEQEEFDSIETPVWLNQCNTVRQATLANQWISAKTLFIGNTVSYGLIESFIAGFLPFLICFLISFLFGPIFSSEYENQMDGLLLASRHGKGKALAAKIFVTEITTILLYAGSVLLFSLLAVGAYGFSDLDATFVFTGGNPYSYLCSPFEFTVGQFLIVLNMVSLCGCMAYCALAVWFSAKCRHSVTATMLSLVCGYAPILMYWLSGAENAPIQKALRFMYALVISGRTQFSEYAVIEIGGTTIRTIFPCMAFLAVTTTACIWSACRMFRKHRITRM